MMIAEFAGFLCRALRRSALVIRDLHRDLEQASECRWLSARAPVPRSGPLAWVPSLDGYRLTGDHLAGEPASSSGAAHD